MNLFADKHHNILRCERPGSRYFHLNIVFREISLPTLLCMVNHSASVGHQAPARHLGWAPPCCCQRGKWFVCGHHRATDRTLKQTHILVLDRCIMLLNRLFQEPLCLLQVSIGPTHAELGDLLL